MLSRLFGFAIGFGVVLCASIFFAKWRSTPPRVLSESDGEIRTVEIQYTIDSAPTNWPPIASFLKQLDPSVELIAVCGTDKDAAAFRAASATLPVRKCDVVVVGAAITGWSKDRFLVASKGSSTLLDPRAEPSALGTRTNDGQVAGALSRSFPGRFSSQDTGLVFDAGDILCTPNRVIIDDEIAVKNPGVGDLIKRVEEMTSRSAVWLKGAPSHHIGMFVAPLDDHMAIVGDPDLGAKLWTIGAARKLGRPDLGKGTTEPFRRAIADLQSAGFRLIRVPLVVMEPRVYVTYTNAVFDQRGGRRIVYMPSYGVPELDDAGAHAYQSQGFEVRPIPVAGVFRLCGTIGCLVNVLERG